MNIATKIQRIEKLRNRIRSKLIEWNIAASDDKLDALTSDIESIAYHGGASPTLDTSEKTYTIPKGYHSGAGKVSITLETKTVTPTKKQQKIMPTEGKVLSDVTIAPIPDAYQDVTPVTAGAADVLSGKKIVSETGEVTDGTIPVNGDVSATIDGLTTTSCTIPAGHTTGGTVSLTSDIEDALDAIVGGENSGIQSELASLAESKADIAAAIENKGVDVPSGTKLDGMAALIGQIQQGGTSVETYTGTITSLGDSVDIYYTDGNTLAGNSGGVWADMGVPNESITIAKGTYITVVGSKSNTLAGTNVGYLTSYYIDVTGQYVHIAEPNGDNFEIIGG